MIQSSICESNSNAFASDNVSVGGVARFRGTVSIFHPSSFPFQGHTDIKDYMSTGFGITSWSMLIFIKDVKGNS